MFAWSLQAACFIAVKLGANRAVGSCLKLCRKEDANANALKQAMEGAQPTVDE